MNNLDGTLAYNDTQIYLVADLKAQNFKLVITSIKEQNEQRSTKSAIEYTCCYKPFFSSPIL
jgi:hypothetical protein